MANYRHMLERVQRRVPHQLIGGGGAAYYREGPVRRAGLGGTAEQMAQHPHV